MAFAPDNSNYVLTAPDLSLSNYHVLGGGKGLSFTPGAAQGNSSMDAIGNLALLADLATSGYVVLNSSGGALYTRTFVSSPSVAALNGSGVGGATSFTSIDGSSVQKINVLVEGDAIGTVPSVDFYGTGGSAINGVLDDTTVKIYVNGGGGGGGAPTAATYYLKTGDAQLPNGIGLDTLDFGGATLGLLQVATNGTPSTVLPPAFPDYFLSYDLILGQSVWVPISSGTVTSVEFASPNTGVNAVWSGDNPITTAGTATLALGTPILFAPGPTYNLFVGGGPFGNGVDLAGSGNLIIGSSQIDNFSDSNIGNTILGMAAIQNMETMQDSLVLGYSSLTATTNMSSSMSIGAFNGASTLFSITDTILLGNSNCNTAEILDSLICIGRVNLNSLTGTGLDSVVIGNSVAGNTLNFTQSVYVGSGSGASGGAGAISDSVAMGYRAAYGATTFTDSITIGAFSGLNALNYDKVVLLGKNSDISNLGMGEITNVVALGYQSIAEESFQCVIGDPSGYSLSLFEYGHGTPSLSGTANQMVVWIDSISKLWTVNSANVRQKGAVVLANQGVTSGTQSVGGAAQTDPVVTISTTAVSDGSGSFNKSLIMISPTNVDFSLPYTTNGMVAYGVGSVVNGTSFDIQVIGTLTDAVAFDWFIVNS